MKYATITKLKLTDEVLPGFAVSITAHSDCFPFFPYLPFNLKKASHSNGSYV